MTFPELFQAIEERRELIVAATEKLDESIHDLDNLDNEIGEMPGIEHRFETVEAIKASDEYFHFLASVAELEDQMWDLLIEAEKTAIEELHHCQHEIDHGFNYALEKQTQIQKKRYDIEDCMLDLELLLDDCAAELSAEFSDFCDQSVAISDSVHQSALETTSLLTQFGHSISDDLTKDIGETFESMRQNVQSITRSQLPAESNRYRETMTRSFDVLMQSATDQANLLGDSAEIMLLDLISLVEFDAMGSIRTMYDSLIQEAIDPMAETMKQCEATMQGGLAITNAISPWLQSFMRIKEMVEMVQSTVESD